MRQHRRPAGDEEDELVAEINSSSSKGVARGVKRRCLDTNCPGVATAGEIERGRSFLETKWELETTRRRKYATHAECPRPTTQPDTATDGQDRPENYSKETNPAFEDDTQGSSPIPKIRDTQGASSEQDPTSDSGSPDEDTSLDGQPASDLPASPTEEAPSCDQPTSLCEDRKASETVADEDATTLAQAFNSDCYLQDTQNSEETGETEANSDKGSGIGHGNSPGPDGPFPAISVVIEHKSQSAATEGKALIAEEATLIRSALRSAALDGEDEELLNNFLSRAKAKRAANAAVTPKDGDQVQSAPADLLPESPTPRSRRALEELDTNSPSLAPSSSAKIDGVLVAAGEDTKDAGPKEPEDPQLASPTRRRSSRTKLSKAPKRAPPPAVPNQIPVRRPKGTEFVFLQRTEAQELALTTRRNTKRNRGNARMPKEMLQTLAQRQEDDSDSTSGSSRSRRRRGKGKTVSWSEQLVAGSSSCTTASPSPAPATPRALSPASIAASLIPTAVTTASESDLSQRKRLAPKAPGASSKGTIARSRLPARTTGSSTSSSKPPVKSKSSGILPAAAGSTPMPKRVRARR
ncbi:hypothetical protein DTO271G3_2820 [Paecilomyces variotii]|nr:hypothetical protein DTO271G3_2820 [Paecilomyces variotii]